MADLIEPLAEFFDNFAITTNSQWRPSQFSVSKEDVLKEGMPYKRNNAMTKVVSNHKTKVQAYLKAKVGSPVIIHKKVLKESSSRYFRTEENLYSSSEEDQDEQEELVEDERIHKTIYQTTTTVTQTRT